MCTAEEKTMARRALIAGSLTGFLAVATGAFGAHALRGTLSADRMAIYETGVRYAMYHALALLMVGVVSLQFPSPTLRRAGLAFAVGIPLFSGSLWLLALTDIRWLGAITPFGGLSFLAGWLWLAAGAARALPTRPDEPPPRNSSG